MSSPNIILITCHDIGRHLDCYGVNTVRSPNLDRLADSGVRFNRAFSTSCGCSPSRASIATGRFPHSNGVMGLTHPPFNWDLNPSEIHIARCLGGAGYETHLFGFQHVSPDAARLGFDGLHCDGMTDCANPGLGCNVRVELETFLQAPRSKRPLYLELNLEESHRPYDQGGALPDTTKGVFVPGYLPVATESTREMAALQGAIRQADESIGDILEMLDRAGLAEDAIIVFVADHGIAMPRAKCTLYDAGVGIALLISWANGGIPRGGAQAELVSNIDIMPTLLELIGAPIPESVQGQSLVPLLLGRAHTSRSEIYTEKTWHSYYDPMRSIRTDRYKLIRNFEPNSAVEVPSDVEQSPIFRRFVERYHAGVHPRLELYDLRQDPDELNNLVDRPKSREILGSLNSQLNHWMESTQDPLLNGFVPSPTGSHQAG
ncbi:MAG TPA: sulfatase [Chloroflexota bacterium]|jgi:arylsulfatase A-like enzyme|nr:sulfatase [Chloroflexota bacterium]